VNLSHLTLRRLLLDLKPLEGSLIQDASLAQPNTLILDLAKTGGAPVTRLLVSGSRSQSRICITEFGFPSSPDRPPWVERYLLKARILSISLQPDDRILAVKMDKQDRVGSRYTSTLVIEMIAQDSNAILVDPSGKIQGLLRTHTSERRKLHPGATFSAAPPQDRALPESIDATRFRSSVSAAEDPVDAVISLCAGMDRNLARELVYRAEQLNSDLLTTIRDIYTEPPFDESPGCILSPAGRRTAPVAYKPLHLSDERFEATETISVAIERTFEDGLKGIEKRGKKKDLLRTVKRAVKTAITKRERIACDLEKARDADTLEKKGSLILANPQAIEPRASSVDLKDLFSDTPATVTIKLNPNQSPAENGEGYLKRAAKARKSVPVLERRLRQTGETIAELESLSQELEGLESESAIDAFRTQLVDRGLIRAPRPKTRPGNPDSSGFHPRRYRTSDGWEIWVGRNNSENDRITKTAPRNAIWFHTHGCPGSHVLLRPRDQREPSAEALNDAASLAAYWSKARGSKTVPVNYTEARYVQKPKGAPPGLVTIRNEKTLFVRPHEIDRWNLEK
jgi:predicted ribosome quality control (RQC) complex YloA/Tae2 family protein